MKRVLILCTGNSCRSHMAEGWLRHIAPDEFLAASAGSNPTGSVHPLAVAVMAEVGVDLSDHTSKHVNGFLDSDIDVVITVCDNAKENCPTFPGEGTWHHWPFEDPPKAVRKGESEIDAFRRIRDEICRTFTAYVGGWRDARK